MRKTLLNKYVLFLKALMQQNELQENYNKTIFILSKFIFNTGGVT